MVSAQKKFCNIAKVLVQTRRLVIDTYGNISKLRGSPVKLLILNYDSNIIVAYANYIRYSKKSKDRDNPQPSF